jgi:transposase-like protein
MSIKEGILTHIKDLFFRERILHIFKAVALVAYHCGLGYGLTSRVLEAFGIKVSAISVRDWVMRCESIELTPQKVRRKRIAVDETIVVINKAKYYVWIVVDIATEEILAFHVSKGATIFDAVYVIKEALQFCKGKPRVFTDDGAFYGSALKILRLKQTVVCFGPRSAVERAFSKLGPRMEIIGKGYRNSPAEFVLERLRRWVEAMMNLTKMVKRSLT